MTIGRQQLAPFAILSNHWFLMRMIDPPSVNQSIPQGLLLFDRGPFLVEDEQDLLIRYNIQLIVSKNSGGEATYGKVIAARQLNLPIIMIQRPVMPIVDVINDVEEAINMIWNYVKKSGV